MADIDDFDDEEERKRRAAASAPEFTAETIAADIWTAVYHGIPLGAGPDLLRQAHGAAMQCAGAVAGPPGLSIHAFEPMQGELGADKSREENFEHAVRRLDELNSRLRPAMLDDEAERQAPEQQPAAEKARAEFTPDDVQDESWAVVEKEIPRDADTALLEQAQKTVLEKVRSSEDLLVTYDGVPGFDEQAPYLEERLEKATARLDELNEILDARRAADISRPLEKEPMTIEAIERDRWNAVNQPIPEALSDELLTAAKEAVARCAEEAYRDMMAAPVEFGGFDQDYQAARARGAELDEIAHERSDANEIFRPLDAVARLRELENERDSFVIGAPDGTETHDPEEWRLQNPEDAEELERLEGSRPLGAAELAERVRRIIEDPSLADAERDDRVLQVVEERREEQSQAEAVRQDDAPQVDSSQEPETQSTADRDAAEVDYLFGREEMTEARSAAYDRFTGQELSPRTGQSAGAVQEPGQSQSHSKGRSR